MKTVLSLILAVGFLTFTPQVGMAAGGETDVVCPKPENEAQDPKSVDGKPKPEKKETEAARKADVH